MWQGTVTQMQQKCSISKSTKSTEYTKSTGYIEIHVALKWKFIAPPKSTLNIETDFDLNFCVDLRKFSLFSPRYHAPKILFHACERRQHSDTTEQ